MHLSFALVALAAYLAVLLRVLTYRRNGARHRHRVSWFAWAIVAVSGGSAIEFMLSARHAGFFDAASAVVLAVLVFTSRGNVAHMLRSDQQ
ncbi:phage holin family protein [Paraburkholderia unamae]|uniref:phage holin family protein n=1 Tax=Paraburkholderia unamae TaxID=219649 RepID=UPI000DD41B35|nr:phage holin family protein [Paraburkholderia unamae]